MEMVLQQRGGCSTTPPSPRTTKRTHDEEAGEELRRGPWTVDEDLTLINYIAEHGDGRWNELARAAGLKRTGKSCRLRWLNYLRPDVKRGYFTADEQLLILDLHSRWGNRWSKIAQQLPGRTDNEIKNYWRTRVQKHRRFKDAMTYLWMPQQQPHPVVHGAGNDSIAAPSLSAAALTTAIPAATPAACSFAAENMNHYHSPAGSSSSSDSSTTDPSAAHLPNNADHEFWSDDMPEDLTGWVQGFSDNTLWSLHDIWRMPQ